MPFPHELFHVTFQSNNPNVGSTTWEDCSDVRRNGDLTVFKDKYGKMVILTGGAIIAEQQEATPDELKSKAGIVIPPTNIMAGLK